MDTSLGEIERDLLLWAGRVAAGEAELLRLIGEWDAREGWGAAGALSCAHWVSWKLGYGIVASRERVRVARRLRELPGSAKAMAAGELSYTQARAITRIAVAEDEQTWLELARETTATQLQKAVRGVRRARKPVEEATDPVQAAFRDGPRVGWDEDGTLVLTFRIPPADAPAALAALEQATAAEQSDRDAQIAAVAASLTSATDASTKAPDDALASVKDASAGAPSVPQEYHYEEPEYPGMAYLGWLPSEKPPWLDERIKAWHVEKDRRQAKARLWQEHETEVLAEAARRGAITRKATLTDGLIRLLTCDEQRQPRVKLSLLIDPMSGWTRTSKDELLPPAITTEILTQTGQRLPRIRPITSDDLLRHDRGRSTRLVTPTLRALLGQLDGECCRFPGCTRTSKLQAHHVRYWRDGGRTDLQNLALVCGRHHTLIHEQGFELVLHDDRTLIVRTKDGKRLPHLQPQPWQSKEDLDPGKRITSESLPTQWNGDRLDLHHVAWVLSQHAA